MADRYDHKKIEATWQTLWEKENTFAAPDDFKKKKSYLLIEFPYPSGEGLHVGHPRSYTAMDVLARKRRMQGENVLYPIGFDAFGLPAENYAIKTGRPPAEITQENIKNFRRQLKSLGYSFDWTREVITSDPNYYKWTQWIFLKLFEKGLAYKAKMAINWCPKDKIGLANEEVIGGRCERCGTVVEQREKEQWMLKITAYADRLLKDLDLVNYLPRIRTQQENWIGRSEGAEVEFPIVADKKYRFVIFHGYTGSPEANFIPWLKKNLEERGYEVVAPLLPHHIEGAVSEEEDVAAALNATRYDEQTIIIAHSLGVPVALKVIEKLATPIAGLVSVGGFIDPGFIDRERPFAKTFTWKFDAENIKKKAQYIRLLQDMNDDAVSREQAERLGDLLDISVQEVVARESHFCAKEEPEILNALFPSITVFTTRIDTIFGGTFLVISPELGKKWIDEGWQISIEACAYIEKALKERTIEREEQEVSGAFTGVVAKNPATGGDMPVWVAEFVLGAYGTGAVFADAHDERDFALAKKYKIPLKPTLKPADGSDDTAIRNLEICFSGKGILYDSGEFSGLTSDEAIPKMAAKYGKPAVQYKLRDWVFSRQRYWGEPIPMVHCEKDGWVPLPESELPLELPKVEKYQPTDTGESPLAAVTDWVNTTCPKCGGPAKRETDTMPNWAGSSWYYLRYADPKNNQALADEKKLKYWLPVDWYNGGMEHTTLHLLYSRFWHKFLFDIGVAPTPEPYAKRTSHGMILSYDGQKMSKSKGNVVNPDDVVATYGADTMRLYELFMGPFADAIPWNSESIAGVYRFLERVWKIALQPSDSRGEKMDEIDLGELRYRLAKTTKKVTEDIENFSFNTAISTMMELVNFLQYQVWGAHSDEKEVAIQTLLLLLYPFAPHIAAELWEHAEKKKHYIWTETWPTYNEKDLLQDTVTVVVQVNGKLRGNVTLAPAATEEEHVTAATAEPNVAKWLEGKTILKTIVKTGKLVNFVIKE